MLVQNPSVSWFVVDFEFNPTLPLPKPLILYGFLQGFAAGYVGEYLKDTATAEKFNVGEYWVDLQCVRRPSAACKVTLHKADPGLQARVDARTVRVTWALCWELWHRDVTPWTL